MVIRKDTAVVVPVMGLHNDPKYYEKPDDFYPEHFTKEAKLSRPNLVYLPFGEGPRMCIGECLMLIRLFQFSIFFHTLE